MKVNGLISLIQKRATSANKNLNAHERIGFFVSYLLMSKLNAEGYKKTR
jgi:hypothetical protein